MWNDIKEYLFKDDYVERACYLLCGRFKSESTETLLACYLVIPDEQDYIKSSLTHVSLKQEFLKNVIVECERLGLSFIDIHSHPFSRDDVFFSQIDNQDELEKASWFSENIPKCYFGSIVFGTSSHKARLRFAGHGIIDAKLRIRVLEKSISPRKSISKKLPNEFSSQLDRQIRAFGELGQRRFSNATIGIIGLGGIGSQVAEGLARLGVGKLVFIDSDRLEVSNINRVSGTSLRDAKNSRWKVNIARSNVKKINPKIRCSTSRQDITKRNVFRKLLECDLIVSATDNQYSRMFLNMISHQYFIPQLSLGTLIESDGRSVVSASGHVRVLLPGDGKSCMICSQILDPVEAYYEGLPDQSKYDARNKGYIKDFDVPDPSVVHLNGVISNLGLVEIHNLFSPFKSVSYHLLYDAITHEIFSINETQPGCAVCESNGGIYGRGDLVKPSLEIKEVLGHA